MAIKISDLVSAKVMESFVADGAITAGKFVALQTDGTVKEVGVSSNGDVFGTEVEFESSGNTLGGVKVCYDDANNKIVVAWYDTTDYDIKAVVGTVTGTSVSFGTPTTVSSGSNLKFVCACTFDPDENHVVLTFADVTGTETYSTLGTISGTTISFGGTTSWGHYTNPAFLEQSYDVDQDITVVAYQESGDTNVKCRTIDASGSTPSLGTAATISTSTTLKTSMDICYDETADRTIVVYQNDTTSDRLEAAAISVSGTTCTPGTAANFASDVHDHVRVTYDSVAGKTVVAYENGLNFYYRVLSISGSTITFNSEGTIASSTGGTIGPSLFAAQGNIFAFYTDDLNSDYGTYAYGPISGNTITFSAEAVFLSNDLSLINAAYGSSSNRAAIVFRNATDTNEGQCIIYHPAQSSTNAGDMVGVAQETVADTETVNVVPTYHIDSHQSGLTIDTDYWLEDDGTLATSDTGNPKAGRALTATKIQIGV